MDYQALRPSTIRMNEQAIKDKRMHFSYLHEREEKKERKETLCEK